MNERQERFIELLRQIFELDKADLDFGIYRILNIRRREIEEFFTTRLPQKITETLQPFATGNKDNIRQRMAEIEQMFAGMDMETLPASNAFVAEYRQLKQQLQQGTDLSALESDVYSALYSFFSRYYDEGDFISKRRYKEGIYAIPYEGEEVKLYWANQDQYYIKTSENFKDYTFVADGYNIHFRLVDATTEQNNSKESDDKKRKFMLFTENEEQYPGVRTFEVEGKNVNIRFFYDVPKDSKVKYEETNLAAINEWINSQPDVDLRVALLRIVNPDAKADKRKTIVQKHLEAYVAKNSFDYFIHKDLGGFLSRELDFFIKNEVMHLDDLDTESEARVDSYLAKVRAIKRVGKDIITFLAQLENFQKRLWLKKKFVVETNWCITLDRVPEKFYPEIIASDKQRQEWVRLFAIDEIKGDLTTEAYSEPLTIEFLMQNPFLVLDTAFFNEDFKNRLVAEIDELDMQTNGLLINSENYQALQMMQEKYKNSIKCVYIDPPYNTGSDNAFAYKDNYQHSSWASMMRDRTSSIKKLMNELGCLFISTDDGEYANLKQNLDEVFSEDNFVADIIWNSRKSVSNDALISGAINHTTFFCNNKKKLTENKSLFRVKANEEGFSNPDNDPMGEWKLDPMDAPGIRENESYGITNPKTGDVFFPAPGRHWRFEETDTLDLLKQGRILFGRSGNTKPAYKRYKFEALGKGDTVTTLWDDVKTTAEGTKLLLDMFGDGLPKSFIDSIKPKPLEYISKIVNVATSGKDFVFDYFSGSATTGHAVIANERDNAIGLKYILCEMNYYFDILTRPRIEKAIYSENWRDGKPVSRNGISQCFKYIRLEQYEDALNNIRLIQDPNMQNLFGDDYTLQYMLDIESRDSLLNVKAFTTPFEYEMRITEKNETKARKVDVCETFNYLIGLNVIRQGAIQRYQTSEARHPEYEGAVDLVIDREGVYQFRQIEGTLRDGKRVLVIWRNITDDLLASNAALDAYFTKYRINPLNRDYDIIYVNGDSNIENLRTDDEHWKVVRTETEFNKRMFEDC